MKKQLVALSLIVIVLLILSSTSLVKGYIDQYTAVAKVDQIKDSVAFSTQSGYLVKMTPFFLR